MNARLSTAQKTYLAAKANLDLRTHLMNEAEHSFVVRENIRNPDGSYPYYTFGVKGITEEEFHQLSTRLCEYEPYAEAFEAYTDAAEAYRQASEALIDWSLSLPGFPAREKEILNEHRREYSTRKKLIELALAIDPATIPKQ